MASAVEKWIENMDELEHCQRQVRDLHNSLTAQMAKHSGAAAQQIQQACNALVAADIHLEKAHAE